MPRDMTGSVVRNLFALQRLANGANADVRDLLVALFDEIAGLIAKNDPIGVLPRYRRQRVERLMREIEALTGETFEAFHRDLRSNLARIGKEQGIDIARMIANATDNAKPIASPVTINQLKAILDSDPFQGDVLKNFAAKLEADTVVRLRRQIQLGMAQNETLDDIVRRVRGRSAGRRGRFVGGVMETTTKEAESIVRTSVNFISNRAHQATYAANADVVTGVEFTATLDSRTSPICQATDGKKWQQGDPNILTPPLHYRCRSVLVPIIDWESLGMEPPPEGTRASAGGPVPASTTYDQWLRNQPASVQDEVLGPGRGRLYRRGGVTLDQMVRTDGRVVRVRDLEQRSLAV